MISKKLILVSGLSLAAAAANATITLTSSGTFTLGGTYNTLGATPTYSANSSITSIVLNDHKIGSGSLNQWWFSVSDTSDITSITYQITLSGITTSTVASGLITGMQGSDDTVGAPIIIGGGTPWHFNLDAATGNTASTQTLHFTEYLIGSGTNTDFVQYAHPNYLTEGAFFKANFQFSNLVPEPTPFAALGIGAVGLLVRRNRKK